MRRISCGIALFRAWALPAGRQDRVDRPDTQRLAASRRRRTGCGVARSDASRGACDPAVRGELKAVTQSPELPVAIIAVVDSRLAAGRAQTLQAGLLKMGRLPGSPDSLAPLRLRGFVPPRLPALHARSVIRQFCCGLSLLALAACATQPASPVAGAAVSSVADSLAQSSRMRGAASMSLTHALSASWRRLPCATRRLACHSSPRRWPVSTDARSPSDSMRAHIPRARASS